MPRLLLIDDDEHLGPPLAAYLQRSGFELVQATRPSEGLARLRGSNGGGGGGTSGTSAGPFDAVILDVMLPEMDGFETCRAIRRESQVPIIMLTARGDVMDRVVGLELGADDYLPKPFEPRELLARLHTVLRRLNHQPRAAPATKGRLVFEHLVIDLDRREVHTRGAATGAPGAPLAPLAALGEDRLVELTGTEFELLALLAAQPGRVFSRDDILTRLRGHAAEDIASRAVDILVSRLRRKLEPLEVIRTLRNAGYVFTGVRA
ncbi:MAG: response regulator transcription factor [Rubrivivax sp.]|nr:response regulator transcription factor [Rubrivivax sp.]